MYFPAGQLLQADQGECAEYFPIKQMRQSASASWPSAKAIAALVSTKYFPATHIVQDEDDVPPVFAL